jgi:hypothetical protein
MATQTEVHTFSIAFWRMYFAAVVYAQVLFAPCMWFVFLLLSWGLGDPFPSAAHAVLYVLGSLMLLVALAPAFWVYVRRLVVKVSPEGLTCSNGFGKLVTVPWEGISRVRPLILPGFPYLLVKTDRTRLWLWLPLFLKRMPEFVEQVERHAGADHMLYQALWPRVEQKG